MANFYDKDTIRKELEARKEESIALLAAWEKVDVLKTKSGAEYKNIGSAIQNATYKTGEYATRNDEKIVAVYTKVGFKYISDYIYAYQYADNMQKDDPRVISLNGRLYDGCVRVIIPMSGEEIRTAIENKKLSVRDNIKSLSAQIAALDDVYDSFYNSMRDAMKEFKEKCLSIADGDKNNFPHSLFYAVLDTVYNGFRYL